ncbi:DnaJ domain-containing protein [Flavobacterium sp. NKUCC04_CG]|uniref:DnaJ domain-containing protein n=1 Tax=Flavobacterium sp. NKUCC04_CG TaxID=2842121 RepID=UPI001C5AA2F7|nr:DnaJ domain-containing protein [Flavobacterium sp. NKUCC04_CG]MBW3519118.1 DnaJ domain-containing protein [Flavobacterium sp. NKUCC04_CG]
MKDYYKILGVSRTATSSEIKNAYRKLSMLYHPDRHHGEEKFNGLFVEINEAYQTLYKEEQRSRYDLLWKNKDRPNQSSYRPYQQEQSYIQPIITQFFVDKIFFTTGDVVTITWHTLHADSIELRPFGFVSAQGIKKIKINHSNLFLEIDIIALNSVSKRYFTSKIVLENTSHPQSKNKAKKENPLFDDKYSLRKELLSTTGKLGRFSYFKRMFSIVFIALLISPAVVFPLEHSSIPLTILITITFVLGTIQSIKRLNALQWSWYYCILFLIPYVNLLALFLLIIIPNSKNSK